VLTFKKKKGFKSIIYGSISRNLEKKTKINPNQAEGRK
jgi:hypothetical protein